MIVELFTEIFHEITADPTTFAIEVVQFAILVMVIKVVAFGFGKRKGFVTNMLGERQRRIEQRIAVAEHAATDLAEARDRAAERIGTARSAAAQILLDARAEARSVMDATQAEIDKESEEQQVRANETLATELEEMHVEVREQLVELVAGATRSILSESYGPSEQRALIQRSILKGIDHIESDGQDATEVRAEVLQ